MSWDVFERGGGLDGRGGKESRPAQVPQIGAHVRGIEDTDARAAGVWVNSYLVADAMVKDLAWASVDILWASVD